MIIKDKEIVTIINHLYNQYFDFKDITINSMDVAIDEFIKIKANASYCNVDTNVSIIAKAKCVGNDIIINTRGIIKYGFINLDFNKVIKEYLKDKKYAEMIKIDDDEILVKNEYIKSLNYGNGIIEVALK